jgi:small nuclear ribonucleoprotein (snRNP)-like protein
MLTNLFLVPAVPYLQLPLSLLRTAQGHPMLVELKNGDTYNGRLEQCDSWMNVKLLEVIWTSRDGDRFWKLPEVYIRGNSIKYMTIPNEVLEMVAEEEESKEGTLCSSMRFSESMLSTLQWCLLPYQGNGFHMCFEFQQSCSCKTELLRALRYHFSVSLVTELSKDLQSKRS